jgi:dolichol-phosphate mannosyltransferase
MDSIIQVREINISHGLKPRVPDFVSSRLPLAQNFIKFCFVGTSGFCVDMAILFFLADSRSLGLNIIVSKICSAEIAMINNFIWNELWTFRRSPVRPHRTAVGSRLGESSVETKTGKKPGGVFRRFFLFNAICGVGIGLAVLLLHLFHARLEWNLYLSNVLAIILVTFWNFGMNLKLNWSKSKTSCDRSY